MKHIRINSLMFVYCLLVFCVLSALLYDHARRGYFLTSSAWNASDYIERALQKTAVCTKNDRFRHRALLHTLQAWTHLVHSHQLPSWISHQTLVSYVLYHNLALYDLHIDLSMIIDHSAPYLWTSNAQSIVVSFWKSRSSSASAPVSQSREECFHHCLAH